MFAVDTNIFLYAAIREFPEHSRAAKLLEGWRAGEEPWGATWKNIYEFLRVSTHAAVLQRPLNLNQALQFVGELFSTPNFHVFNETNDHLKVLQHLGSRYPRVAANLVHDFHTAVILFEHGLRTLYTADTDFLQFEFLKVIDPVHPSTEA